MTEWKLVSEEMPPRNGSHFQVAWYGEWSPICKADEVGIYELSPDWDNGHHVWDLLAKFGDSFPSTTHVYWAPTPVLPPSVPNP